MAAFGQGRVPSSQTLDDPFLARRFVALDVITLQLGDSFAQYYSVRSRCRKKLRSIWDLQLKGGKITVTAGEDYWYPAGEGDWDGTGEVVEPRHHRQSATTPVLLCNHSRLFPGTPLVVYFFPLLPDLCP